MLKVAPKKLETPPKERVAGAGDVHEVLDLRAEEQEPELREGEVDDQEHDGEPGQVLGAGAEGAGQLVHRLVEGEVLEHLDPGDKHVEPGEIDQRLHLVAQHREVRKLEGELDQVVQLLLNHDEVDDVEEDLGDGHTDNHQVQDVA